MNSVSDVVNNVGKKFWPVTFQISGTPDSSPKEDSVVLADAGGSVYGLL